ncbi:MAG: hypothetical protein KKF46_07405 [Nanoarchaeota archaeon]|nr:hypothetical protein [Nanoarchaeota archaeon]MBU1322154.1 hypothetical protein [Nanoarchaeota archaeon]MBU1597875.1 hypothetical protein [Nanoarchaeota archaeon]MBU2441294.1 hypothetical protein [Nanoarchaeota archaeon]
MVKKTLITIMALLALQFGCGISSETQSRRLAEKEKNIYQQMDVSLQKKDLREFANAYTEAVKFKEELNDSERPYITFTMWRKLFDSLNQDVYGPIYVRINYDSLIIDKQHNNSPPYSFTREGVRVLMRGLIMDIEKNVPKFDNVDDWEFTFYYDDQTLDVSKRGVTRARAESNQDFRSMPPGEYAIIQYNRGADVVIYSHLITSKNGTESKVTRLCDLIDLGGDGIDGLDAALNGIETDDDSIKEANKKIFLSISSTSRRFKERYQAQANTN